MKRHEVPDSKVTPVGTSGGDLPYIIQFNKGQLGDLVLAVVWCPPEWVKERVLVRNKWIEERSPGPWGYDSLSSCWPIWPHCGLEDTVPDTWAPENVAFGIPPRGMGGNPDSVATWTFMAFMEALLRHEVFNVHGHVGVQHRSPNNLPVILPEGFQLVEFLTLLRQSGYPWLEHSDRDLGLLQQGHRCPYAFDHVNAEEGVEGTGSDKGGGKGPHQGTGSDKGGGKGPAAAISPPSLDDQFSGEGQETGEG